MGKGQRSNASKLPAIRQQSRRKTPSAKNVGIVVQVHEGKRFGFLKCKESENGIFFHFDRIISGALHIIVGDNVEYSLSNKESGKGPSVFLGTLIAGNTRNATQLNDFLDRVKDTTERSSLEQCASSEETLKTLSCMPAWKCVIESLRNEDSVLKFMKVFNIMNDSLKSFKSHIKSIADIIAGSKLLDVKNSPLVSLIERDVFTQNKDSLDALRAFMLAITSYTPDKARNVVRLIEPFAENSNVPRRLFYDLLEAVTCNASSSIGGLYWKELPLVPAIDEIEKVLDNQPSEYLQLQPIKKTGAYGSPDEYFEILFRLLRADCFQSFKEGINKYLDNTLDKRDLNVYIDVRIVGFHIRAKSRICLAVKLRTEEKKMNWDKSTKLMFGNLLCISMNGQFNDVMWTTVASRDHLQSHQIVLVELCTELNSMPDVDSIKFLTSSTGRGIAAESPTYYRAYGPILKALQKQHPNTVSFKEELVYVRQTGKPDFLSDSSSFNANIVMKLQDDFLIPMKMMSDLEMIFDDSQKDAMIECLNQKIGIIQGPPGTGKTFIGVKLVQLLLSLSSKPSGPILVLTYKNHALDEFLKAIVDVGIKDVVRVGGGSKDGATNEFNLSNIERKIRKNQCLFQQMEAIGDELYIAENEVKNAFDKLTAAKSFSLDAFLSFVNDKQLHDFLTKCPWVKVEDANKVKEKVAQLSYGDLKRAAESDASLKQLIAQALEIWMPSHKEVSSFMKSLSSSFCWLSHDAVYEEVNDDSAEDVDSDDEKDVQDMLIDRQSAVGDGKMQFNIDSLLKFDQSNSNLLSLCEFATDFWETFPTHVFSKISSLWKVKKDDKPKLLQYIIQRNYDTASEEFREKLKVFEQQCNVQTELLNQHRADILKEKDVVAMTITGASINYDLLQAVKPSIVIIEEAAELLEAQLVPALGSWTKQLILIGDHKQLKPPVETYFLERDFNMDLSLMERLINNGFKYSTLMKQNRMRPEFADLLLDIYPNLQSNLDRVSQNEKAKCLLLSAYFWDHESKEVYDRSASNDEEAMRAVNLAVFMIEQGIDPCKITILSAYKGQNGLIRKKLRAEESQGRLKDLQGKDNKIVTHTIDNYQGDENDFVIISLVRSNDKKKIGFLKLLNRRCVAQSRSRCGLYFIGNCRMFSENPSWAKMLDKMRANRQLTGSIILVCPRHPQSRKKATSSHDLNSNGLCRMQCSIPLACSHSCKRTCQPKHAHDSCDEKCLNPCGKCHSLCKKKCRPLHSHDACGTLIEKQLPCSHIVLAPCNTDNVLCVQLVSFTAAKCRHLLERKCYESEDDVKCEKACSHRYHCGHFCNRRCWEACNKDCYVCEKIEQMKEKQREEEERKIRKVLEDVEKRRIKVLKDELAKEPVREELSSKGDTADLYLTIEDQVKKYVQPGHNWYPVVTKIERVTNYRLEKEWREAKLQMYDPSMRSERKFHGTSKEAIENIIKVGFILPKKPGMYGKGIYFATDSSKSAQDIYTKGSGMLLLCEVLLGKTKLVESAMPDMTAEKLRAESYDSLFAKRDTKSQGGVLYDEYVVYNSNQALPSFIISYTTKNALSRIALPRSLVLPNKMTKHLLTEKRSVNTDDPLDMHYRIAESQFLRLMNVTKSKRRITSITYYSNPMLEKKFDSKVQEFKTKGYNADCIFGFHGTAPNKVDTIMQTNFRMDLIAQNTGNPGQFGAGIYFSEVPEVCFHYGYSLLLCKVLLGNCRDVTKVSGIKGKPLTNGFNSHGALPTTDGHFQIIVIFNNEQILPCYLIESLPI